MAHGLLQRTLSKMHDGRGTLLTHLTYFQHGWSHIELVECTNSAPPPTQSLRQVLEGPHLRRREGCEGGPMWSLHFGHL